MSNNNNNNEGIETAKTIEDILPISEYGWKAIRLRAVMALAALEEEDEDTDLSFGSPTLHDDGIITISVFKWVHPTRRRWLANLEFKINYSDKKVVVS